MKSIDSRTILLWGKRLLIYVCGLFGIALGVAFAAKSGLGVSPVGSPANVLYQIGLDVGLSDFFQLGTWTVMTYCVYILFQILLLKKEFRPIQFLQLVVSFLFGYMVNTTVAMLSGLPAPSGYALRMLYLLVSVPLVAAGVMLYLSPDLLSMPGEGMSLAISKSFGISVPTAITIFYCAVVVIAAVISLIHFRGLVGVREGTVIAALFTGPTMRQLQKVFQKPLLRFVER